VVVSGVVVVCVTVVVVSGVVVVSVTVVLVAGVVVVSVMVVVVSGVVSVTVVVVAVSDIVVVAVVVLPVTDTGPMSVDTTGVVVDSAGVNVVPAQHQHFLINHLYSKIKAVENVVNTVCCERSNTFRFVVRLKEF